jgi:hypothetical protein
MSVFSCPVCQHILQVVPLLSAQAAPLATQIGTQPTTGDPLRAKLINLKARCTRTTGKVWELVKAVAARPQPCTRQELMTDLNAPSKSVLSWRRILGRCCHPRRLNIKVIERTADGKYQMPNNVRVIVNELG